MRAVVDSSPLIVLAQLGRLGLLGRYARVTVPRQVETEILAGLEKDPAAVTAIRRFLKKGPVRVRSSRVPDEFLPGFGDGERAAMLLASRDPGAVFLVDDHEARTAARRLGLNTEGTLLVLLRAARRGEISKLEAEQDLRRLGGLRFHLSHELLEETIEQIRRL